MHITVVVMLDDGVVNTVCVFRSHLTEDQAIRATAIDTMDQEPFTVPTEADISEQIQRLRAQFGVVHISHTEVSLESV